MIAGAQYAVQSCWGTIYCWGRSLSEGALASGVGARAPTAPALATGLLEPLIRPRLLKFSQSIAGLECGRLHVMLASTFPLAVPWLNVQILSS